MDAPGSSKLCGQDTPAPWLSVTFTLTSLAGEGVVTV
jgi:hypothetical protein